MRQRGRLDTDERADRHDTTRPPEPSRADALLSLQRSAGNQAVGAMLARQPTPTAPKAPPAQEEKAATMTAGLGERLGVIPIDSFSWGASGNTTAPVAGETRMTEVTIGFGPNSAVAAIAQAALNGEFIGKAFVSTQQLTIDFDEVVLTAYRQNGDGGPGTTYDVTLNFANMHIREPS